MSQTMTVSTIAKATGLDRRTLDRHLAGVEPAATRALGGRTSALYAVADVARALLRARVPREVVARLLPFNGSVGRLVAWETLREYVPAALVLLAGERPAWRKRLGLSAEQADAVAASALALLTQAADVMLANFGEHFPDVASADEAIRAPGVVPVDAAPNAFNAALDGDPRVGKLLRELRPAARKAYAP